ncbi:MAG TPA: hypothetical protein VFK97_00605 [Candidatus Saccharimonadales bacterium]|nr:hypothetical protein [Candidatus Saccharimonadales bacterium]
MALKFSPIFAAACASKHFFFLPPWWEYLKNSTTDALGQCSPTFNFPNDLWLVGLAILDMLLRLAGFVAVISIIIAGIQHQFTMGDPQKAAAARRRLYNSLIGLAIALIATAAVTFIGNELTK